MDKPAEPQFLPFFLREPIYLVDEPEPVVKSPERTIPDLPCLGSPRNEVLIVVNEPNHEFLSAPDRAFLEKILQAVSLQIEDTVIVNGHQFASYRQQDFSTDELLTPFGYSIAWVLGNAPDQWSLSSHLEPYEISEVDDRQLLQSDPLSVIAGDVEKKGRLWKCLQVLFSSPA